MKKILGFTAAIVSAAFIFASCGSTAEAAKSAPAESAIEEKKAEDPNALPEGMEAFVWTFQDVDVSAVSDKAEKPTLTADYAYPSTPEGYVLTLGAGKYNKIAADGNTGNAVMKLGASKGFVEPHADTLVTTKVTGPCTIKAIVGCNSSSDKTDRYAFIKIGDTEYADEKLKASNILPAVGQVITAEYTGTEEAEVRIGGTGITRIYHVTILKNK